MDGSELRATRVRANLPGRVVCAKAGISRSRLSEIEAGYLRPSQAEIAKISAALSELDEIRNRMRSFAADCGWPVPLR
jgi:transcriptional regulator with XRE-family HTH domain